MYELSEERSAAQQTRRFSIRLSSAGTYSILRAGSKKENNLAVSFKPYLNRSQDFL